MFRLPFLLALPLLAFTCVSCHTSGPAHDLNTVITTDTANKVVVEMIFGNNTTFNYKDFEHLASNPAYERFEIGQLSVPTGKIVCTDPLYFALGLPQTWSVPIGDYPTAVYVGLEGDFEAHVAYAEIVFSQNPIAQWQSSLIDPNLLEDDFEKRMNGMYPVETGLSCFCDSATWDRYLQDHAAFAEGHPDGNYYNAQLAPLFEKNRGTPPASRQQDWLNYPVDGRSDRNMILFGSGWGDGLYPRYVGLDSDGQPVKLLTDFIRLEE